MVSYVSGIKRYVWFSSLKKQFSFVEGITVSDLKVVKQVNKMLGGCSKLTQKLDFQAIRKKMAEFLLRAFSPVDSL
jgi:hypothetical protein